LVKVLLIQRDNTYIFFWCIFKSTDCFVGPGIGGFERYEFAGRKPSLNAKVTNPNFTKLAKMELLCFGTFV